MPYSHITRTAFGADAIRYARGEDGKGHNGAEVRNEYTAGVNMLPDGVVPFEQQMQPLWDRASARHTTQIDRLIVSFAKGELDPEKPEDRLPLGAKLPGETPLIISPPCSFRRTARAVLSICTY